MSETDCNCVGQVVSRTIDTAASFTPTIDASRVLFCVGNATKVSDALHALSFIKGSPVRATIAGGAPSLLSSTLSVQVQRLTSVPQPLSYNLSSTDVQDVAAVLEEPSTFTLARLGGRVRVLTIDQQSTAPNTSQDLADLQLQNAAIGIIRRIDREIGQGLTSGSPEGFDGLPKLCSNNVSGAINFSSALREVMVNVCCNGTAGSGEGIDCFFGGPLVLRKLIAQSVAEGGTGEWRNDERTGRKVFHYLGIPYYRTETAENAETGGALFAANLGTTGLQMLYAYGSRETFGIAAQETPVTTATGLREITVHGAWALVLWEQSALWSITDISLTPPL